MNTTPEPSARQQPEDLAAENGERCPWPWEPQQLTAAPLGQYRCPYCMAMVVAGMPHIDYRDDSPLTA